MNMSQICGVGYRWLSGAVKCCTGVLGLYSDVEAAWHPLDVRKALANASVPVMDANAFPAFMTEQSAQVQYLFKSLRTLGIRHAAYRLLVVSPFLLAA
jgi:hypothetical protein